MKIVDFCISFDEELWKKTLNYIIAGNDELKENYINLSPRDFISWPVLIDNDEIVCFSALQENKERWSKNFARINSRFYINPKYRHRTPGKLNQNEKFLNTKHLLPLQIQKAKELGFKGVFMSREGDHKTVFELYVNLTYKNTGYRFNVLTHRFNICGNVNPIPRSCKQWIALHCFDGDESLWFKVMEQNRIS